MRAVGFRFRKSIKVAPGVRFTVSKSGFGASFGKPGARYSVHSSGRRTKSLGIPGTGVSWVETTSGGKRKRTPVPTDVPPKKPGLFAPRAEKDVYRAVAASDWARLAQLADTHPDYATLAAAFGGLGLLGASETDDIDARVQPLLERAFASGQDPAAHPFFAKYIGVAQQPITLAPGVTTELPMDRTLVGLALAEIYQLQGDLDRATEIVEYLEPTTATAVSLAELYTLQGRHKDVIELTEDISNEDDGTAMLLVYRGMAFAAQTYNEAARESFKAALRSRSRDEAIRHKALFERAMTYLSDRRPATARKDLERLMAEDSDYPGLADALKRCEL